MAKKKKQRQRRRRLPKSKRAIKLARARLRRSRRRGHRAKVIRRRRHKPAKIIDPRLAQALKQYELAIKHFNQQNYRRAREILEKLLVAPSRQLAERARMHLKICEQRLRRAVPVSLKTGDDHYYYAVSLINLQRYDEARRHLEKARKLLAKADYVYYALAALTALTGDSEAALAHLRLAIRLRPENRYQARNDADFKLLESDPRFFELIYPERAVRL